MNRLLIASTLGLAALATTLIPARVQAQCTGDELFCAEASFRMNASFRMGGSVRTAPPPPRRAQVVVVHEPAPPPPPPVVVYQPAPPPPQPTTVYVETQAQPVRHEVHYDVEPVQLGVGLHGHIGGMFTRDVQMGGATGALRIRPGDGHFGVDLGIGVYGGQDHNGWDRVEVPLTADVLLFLNPDDRLQVYGIAGVGVSFAQAEQNGFDDPYFDYNAREYAYVGGELGAGLELRLSRWFAINGDVRGFVRERVDDDPEPEFVADDGRTTDTSGGVLLNLGATVYF